MELPDPVAIWRDLLADTYATWVLFRHNTCVILDKPADDPAGLATALLRHYGPVQVGTNTADFNVVPAPGGRLVTCYRPDILLFVSHAEAPPEQDDLFAGLAGRARRARDAAEPVIRHVAAVRLAQPPCACLDAPGKQLAIRRELGMDNHYSEAAVLACRVCGRRWLRYHYELEAESRSGRWYLGQIPVARSLGITAGEAKGELEHIAWYHTGGSYFGGRIGRGQGEIYL